MALSEPLAANWKLPATVASAAMSARGLTQAEIVRLWLIARGDPAKPDVKSNDPLIPNAS